MCGLVFNGTRDIKPSTTQENNGFHYAKSYIYMKLKEIQAKMIP